MTVAPLNSIERGWTPFLNSIDNQLWCIFWKYPLKKISGIFCILSCYFRCSQNLDMYLKAAKFHEGIIEGLRA